MSRKVRKVKITPLELLKNFFFGNFSEIFRKFFREIFSRNFKKNKRAKKNNFNCIFASFLQKRDADSLFVTRYLVTSNE